MTGEPVGDGQLAAPGQPVALGPLAGHRSGP